MWLTLLFGALNAGLAFLGRKALRFPGLDIAPAAMIFLAGKGENVLFAALVLGLSFSFFSLREMRFLWLSLPLLVVVGYLALAVPNGYLLVAVYEALSLLAAFFLSMFGFRYAVFILTNFATNLVAVWLLGL